LRLIQHATRPRLVQEGRSLESSCPCRPLRLCNLASRLRASHPSPESRVDPPSFPWWARPLLPCHWPPPPPPPTSSKTASIPDLPTRRVLCLAGTPVVYLGTTGTRPQASSAIHPFRFRPNYRSGSSRPQVFFQCCVWGPLPPPSPIVTLARHLIFEFDNDACILHVLK
jgi:hypothetical protein